MTDADREQRMEQVIADYLAAEDAGSPLDRAALLAAHPDLADELLRFFREHDRFDRLAVPLRAAAAPEPLVATPGPVEATVELSSTAGRMPIGPDATTAGAPDGPAGPDLEPGTCVDFGDYVLRKVLGHGGMGVVYEARQVSLHRLVALKMLRAGGLASDDELRRFRNEAEAVAILDHPNIVPILEVGTYDGRRYFTMKLIGGPSLHDRLNAFLDDPKSAARLLATAAQAVHHAHQRGILHRDLKPSNILLDDRGTPYVTDFGLARRVEGDSELTHSGAILGTPSYMAPEQASGRRAAVTTASDVYGLGAVLFAMLTGRAPFGGDSVIDTLEQVRTRLPEPPAKRNPRVPRDLEVICLKCLEKDPSRRYASAQALADDLHRHLAGEPIVARAVGRVERARLWIRRHPTAAALAATSVVALTAMIAAGVFIAYNGELKRANRIIERSRGELQTAYASEALARRQAEAAGQTASEQRAIAVAARDEARNALDLANRYLYLLRVNQAHAAWLENDLTRASALLDECPPDQRGWEWNYLDRQRHASLHELESASGPFIAAFRPDGRPVVVSSLKGALRVQEVETGQIAFEIQRPRKALPIIFGLQNMEDAGLPSPVRLSADGRRLVSATGDHVLVWDTAKGTELLRLVSPVPHLNLNLLAMSADARILVASGHRTPTFTNSITGPVWVWDESRGWRQLIPHDGDQLERITLSPDGRHLAVHSSTTSLWDVAEGRKVVTLTRSDLVTAMAFSPEGRHFARADAYRGSVTVWDVASGREVHRLQGGSLRHLTISFSPDGRRLAVGGDDGLITIWDAFKDKRVLTLRGHSDSGIATTLRFSPDGRRLAVGGKDGVITVWDASTGRQVLTLRGHSREVLDLRFSPDGLRIVSVATDRTAKVWDAIESPEFHALADPDERMDERMPVWRLAFSPDGRRIAVTRNNGQIGIYDPLRGKFAILTPRPDDRTSPRDIVYSPEGRRIASVYAGIQGDKLRVWDLDETSARERFMVQHRAPEGEKSANRSDNRIYSIGFSPDGRRLAFGDSFGVVTLCDSESGREVLHLSKGPVVSPRRSFVRAVAFSPDGRRVAAGMLSTIAIWDISTGAEVINLRDPAGSIDGVAYSPDGSRIAAYSNPDFDDKVKVWNPANGSLVMSLRGHTGSGGVRAVAYSPDGRRMASLGGDKKLKVWDAASGQEVLTLQADTGYLSSNLMFSPDGRYLAFASSGGTVRVLDGSEVSPKQRIEDQVRREVHWSVWRRQQARTCLAEQDWFAAAHHLDQLVAAGPARGSLLTDRAIARYHLGRWDDALADFSRAATLPEASVGTGWIESRVGTWWNESLLRWAGGDVEGSRRATESLLESFGATADPETAAQVSRACIRLRGAVSDISRVLVLAQLAARTSPVDPETATNLGLALYRAGSYDEAKSVLEGKVIKSGRKSIRASLVLAMLHQKLGQPVEARKWLDTAAAEFRPVETGRVGLWWADRIEYRMLRGEAEALIVWGPSFPADPFAR